MYRFVCVGLFAALAGASAQPGQFSNTGDHCTDIGPEFGGWTGKTTEGVTFQNFPGSYSFDTQGYDKSGACQTKNVKVEGPIAPLSDETTYTFRGPMELSGFHLYQPGGGKKQRRSSTHSHEKRHSHQRFHQAKRDAAAEAAPEPKRGDKILAPIDGKMVEIVDTWSSEGGASGSTSSGGGSGAKAPAAQDIKGAAPVQVAQGQWGRVAKYSTAGGKASSEGLAFLMAQKYSDSVSFFKSDGGKLVYAAEHTPLAAGVTVPDDTEFYIASNQACTDSNPCGMAGPNVTAYHGFKGDRVAIFEFKMPLSGSRKCDTYNTPNPDMPCIWALSTHVVNNLQYGNCNGWTAGQGEHDIVEVLSPGSKNMFASMHMGKHYAGTATDSFVRPVDKVMKLAVVYSGSTVHQQVLPADFQLGDAIEGSAIEGLAGGKGVGNNKLAGSGGNTIMHLNQNP